jgi:hypothetical protein
MDATNSHLPLVVPSSYHGAEIALIDGKLNLTTKEVGKVLGSIKIFQRCRHHNWLSPLTKSRDALYPASRILDLQARLQKGEMPPKLPSEIKLKRGGDLDVSQN